MTATNPEHLSAEIAAVLAAADPIRVIPGNPDPLGEYRLEAEQIAEHVLRAEAAGSSSDRTALVKLVRSVFQDHFKQRISKSEAKAIVDEIQARRLMDLVYKAISDEARLVLADGRAALRRHEDFHGSESPAVELDPARPGAAGLVAMIEHGRLVHCSIGDEAFPLEVCSNEQTEIASRVRLLVRALIEGSYAERQKDGRHHSTVRAEWPNGVARWIDSTEGAGGWQGEWRLRAYHPY